MMTFETTAKTIAHIAGLFLTVFLPSLPSAGAEDQAKEKHMIAPQTEIQQDMPRHEGLQPGESTTGELTATSEKPMKVPEGEESFRLEKLLTPNVSDFESARELDSQSSVSF
jgi:hypothetical protein